MMGNELSNTPTPVFCLKPKSFVRRIQFILFDLAAVAISGLISETEACQNMPTHAGMAPVRCLRISVSVEQTCQPMPVNKPIVTDYKLFAVSHPVCMKAASLLLLSMFVGFKTLLVAAKPSGPAFTQTQLTISGQARKSPIPCCS